MVRFLDQTRDKLALKIPEKYHKLDIFSLSSATVLLKKIGLNSDIGLCTSILFLLTSILYGWFGSNLRTGAFIVGGLTMLILINICIMIGYKAWIGHYIYLYQFWVNVPLMLLPVAGIVYQLRDFLKIVGRGKINEHITYSDLSALEGPEPFVSIHIPSYNEEPEMLIRTIEHVLRLNYTNYELIIIENNTADESVWKPVEAFVNNLGKSHIRFYHFNKLD